MRTITFAFLIIMLIGASFVILIKNRNEAVIGAELEETSIEFNKSDLKTCCFYRGNNEIKSCKILKRFDCSICEEKCKEK